MITSQNHDFAEALALLGGGKIAYVKMVRSEDVQRQFPQAPRLAPVPVVSACTRRRHPIMLTDSREAAIAKPGARSSETVSVH
jgi:hypothetical protein